MVESSEKYVLQPGRNCWRNARADRIGLLVDGAAYFEALAEVIPQARKNIYIAGWDFDSRIELVCRPDVSVSLGELLNRSVRRIPELEVYVLVWDWAMIYISERQWLPLISLPWKRHRRITFKLDDDHPFGASQHQKVVVIDDAVAFCGGLDLTNNRWDTPEHLPQHSLRRTPGGAAFGPYHDAQMVVDADAAASLGELFRERWMRATGKKLPSQQKSRHQPWPQSTSPDLTGAPVGIARTLPAYRGRSAVGEIRRLYQDAIAAAERLIYIENQYLTAGNVADSLIEQLGREDGPEIVLVLPRESNGWLEHSTMDAMRHRIFTRLIEADRYGRLLIAYPTCGSGSEPIHVHSKILIVDNHLMTVGSANLSNRSMGLDSECNLVLESKGSRRIANAIGAMRNRLLAEHLGVSEDRLAATLAETASHIGTIAAQRGSTRTLMKMKIDRQPLLLGLDLIPETDLFDPEKPVEFDRLMDCFVNEKEEEKHSTKRRHGSKLIVTLALLLALAASWRWTPLAEVVNIDRLTGWFSAIKGSPLVPLVVVGAYVFGGLLMIPVTLLVGLTGIVFSPLAGTAYALVGCLLSGLVAYGVGARLGRDTVRKLVGNRSVRIGRRLAENGVVAVAIIRNLPVAPFTIVNMLAGASGIKLKAFLIGTALGMLPGILGIVVFSDRLLSVFRSPDWFNVSAAVGVALLIGLGSWWINRRLSRRTGN